MTRLSSMPTIPDEHVPDFDSPSLDDGPDSDYRCKLGQADTAETFLTPSVPANRELAITELLRYPTLLSEDITLGSAVKSFAQGMEEPVVLVTHANRPLGLLDAATVLQLIRGRTVEEIDGTRVLDAFVPLSRCLQEGALLEHAAEHFVNEDRDALLIVKQDGELAGVLMARDLFLLWV